jgi:hypothetical protein
MPLGVWCCDVMVKNTLLFAYVPEQSAVASSLLKNRPRFRIIGDRALEVRSLGLGAVLAEFVCRLEHCGLAHLLASRRVSDLDSVMLGVRPGRLQTTSQDPRARDTPYLCGRLLQRDRQRRLLDCRDDHWMIATKSNEMSAFRRAAVLLRSKFQVGLSAMSNLDNVGTKRLSLLRKWV